MDTAFYAGSDGTYYTDWQVSWRFESGRWKPCMWDSEAGWELVEGDEELIWLWPVTRDELPGWVSLRQVPNGPGVEIVGRPDD